MNKLQSLTQSIQNCTICADRFAATETAHAPRPVAWLSDMAPVLICGQAPGARVHASGVPFDDPSGDRLRQWMGVSRDTFYDRDKLAIMPMAFCFPGYRGKSDLPPPRICAQTWREQAMATMPQVKLILLVGGYAFKWHLADKRPVTDVVRDNAALPENTVALPHPSWRNTGWLKKHPWFEADVIPSLQQRVSDLI